MRCKRSGTRDRPGRSSQQAALRGQRRERLAGARTRSAVNQKVDAANRSLAAGVGPQRRTVRRSSRRCERIAALCLLLMRVVTDRNVMHSIARHVGAPAVPAPPLPPLTLPLTASRSSSQITPLLAAHVSDVIQLYIDVSASPKTLEHITAERLCTAFPCLRALHCPRPLPAAGSSTSLYR